MTEMFERFTEESRTIVIVARREAVELQHPTVGTEHLLLAMLADPGAAGTVLRAAGLQPAAIRSEIVRLVGTPSPLLDEDDAAALRSIGIDVDTVLARIEESFGPQALLPPAEPRRGWLRRRGPASRFGRRSKKVMELSLREAIRLKDRQIGSGHLLLGLLREGQGLAAKIMVDAGVDLATLRDRTEQALRRAA
jgi:ATP-dependent Clp protease ATP-binding subunit ClpA